MSLITYMKYGAALCVSGGAICGAYNEGVARKAFNHGKITVDGLFFYRFMIAAGLVASPFVGAGMGAGLYEMKRAYIMSDHSGLQAKKGVLLVLITVVASIMAERLGSKE